MWGEKELKVKTPKLKIFQLDPIAFQVNKSYLLLLEYIIKASLFKFKTLNTA